MSPDAAGATTAGAQVRLDAYLFDLDGVLTPTELIHRRAWRAAIGDFFERQGVQRPYSEADYYAFIDGKPRYEGVASVLASRGLSLPAGTADAAPGHGSVAALGNLKNQEFARVLAEGAIRPYPDAVELLDGLQAAAPAARLAVVSSSKNAVPVLRQAGLLDRFELVVDGVLAAREGLAGKPSPQTFVYAAERLGCQPAGAAVLEDAISGVAAGRAGGFGLVVGVNRGGNPGAESDLRQAGADLVVATLAELWPLS
jgi:HAD superfamily hydrolase (TIGR01509 family)